jgi:hypothetical protein
LTDSRRPKRGYGRGWRRGARATWLRVRHRLVLPRSAGEALALAPVYFLVALLALRVKLSVTPAWFDGTLERNHRLLLAFAFTNNEQSRLLQYWLPELMRRAFSLSVERAYIVQRWAFVFLALCCFHGYLRRWFPRPAAFAAVTLFAALLMVSFSSDLQESASLLLVTFVTVLWAIREDRPLLTAVALLLGALNNETALVLPAVYLAHRLRGLGVREVLAPLRDTLLVSLPALLTVAAIRYATRGRPHLAGLWQLPHNIEMIRRDLGTNPLDLYGAAALYFLILFGPLWVYAFLGFRRKPRFMRSATAIVPFFVIAQFLVGIVSEVRLFMPLAIVVIPPALWYLFSPPRGEPSESDLGPAAEKAPRTDDPRSAQ